MMMKYTTWLMAGVMLTGVARAELIFEERFDDNWYEGRQIQWSDDWLGIKNNAGAKGNGEGQLSSFIGYRGAIRATDPITYVAPGDRIVLSLDYRFEVEEPANTPFHTFGLTAASTNMVGNSFIAGPTPEELEAWLSMTINYTYGGNVKVLGYFGAPNGDAIIAPESDWGLALDEVPASTVTDEVRLTYVAEKMYNPGQWNVSVAYSNLTTGASGETTGISVFNEEAYQAEALRFAFFQQGAQQVESATNSTMDNMVVDIIRKPQTRIVFEDDFEADFYVENDGRLFHWTTAEIWNKGLNNNDAFVVTNGAARTFNGWNGIATTRFPVQSSTGETIRVSFDYKIDLGPEGANFELGDFSLVPEMGEFFTNSYDNASVYYDGHGAMGLSARLRYNAWDGDGAFPNGRLQFWRAGADEANGIDISDLGIFGLSPSIGDMESDALRLTFEYFKSGAYGEWDAVTTLSNVDTGEDYVITQQLTNVSAYTNDLYMAIQNAGAIAAGAYFEIDNFKVEVDAVPLPLGYRGWIAQWPAADLEDPYADYDGDGLINLHEYALGGDPTNPLDTGIRPNSKMVDVDGTMMTEYCYVRATDADAGLVYYLEVNDDLMHGGWVDAGETEVGVGPDIEGYETVTNRLDAGASKRFTRLVIEQE